ncbi:OmpA family protein [uncultured Arcobacter sp.]|uniref:OmpA family protein n=1 Tax=uncultured Arcobacter sp. TaxID=165434 RepID=UPI00260DBB08|nr:OmpA family protein [uncultured Arcobacter sp.]
MKKILMSLIVAGILVTNASSNECIEKENRIAFGVLGILQGALIGGPIGAFWGLGTVFYADKYQNDCVKDEPKMASIEPKKEKTGASENVDQKLDKLQNDKSMEDENKNFLEVESFVNFAFDSYVIKKVNKDVKSLELSNSNKVVIEGHTDSVGTDEYNFALGLKRAKAVKDYFLKNSVIEEGKLSVVSYGETAPISTNDAENRRVDLKLFNK